MTPEERREQIEFLEGVASKLGNRLHALWREDVVETRLITVEHRDKILQILEEGDWEPLSSGFHDQYLDRGLSSQPDAVVLCWWFRREKVRDPDKYALFVEDDLWKELANNLAVVGLLSEHLGHGIGDEHLG